MAGFEDLIRNALQKHGDPSVEHRTAIYKSSRLALERMLTQNQSLDQNAVASQRQRLEAAISAIEKDYQVQPSAPPPVQPTVAAPADPKPSPGPSPSPAAKPAPMPRTIVEPPPVVRAEPATQEPTVRAPIVQTPTVTPSVEPVQPSVALSSQQEAPGQLEPDAGLDQQDVRLDDYPEINPNRIVRERRPYAKMLLWTIILVGLGVAIWWAITFGPALIKQQLGGSVPNPGQTIESGSFVPDGEEDWVSIFNPAEDAANIDSGGRGTADLFQDGNSNFVRLASTAGSSRNTLRIKIPRGVMLPLRGQAATLEVLLRNPAEKPHQFAVFCEFGAMGSCGRKRFKAGSKVEAFIFDVLVNDAALAENEDAYISINTDLGGDGNALDLFAIRVRASK